MGQGLGLRLIVMDRCGFETGNALSTAVVCWALGPLIRLAHAMNRGINKRDFMEEASATWIGILSVVELGDQTHYITH